MRFLALPTHPKDQFSHMPVIFYTKASNSVDQRGNCRCERELPLHRLRSVELSRAAGDRAAALLTRAPGLQTLALRMNSPIEPTAAVYVYDLLT